MTQGVAGAGMSASIHESRTEVFTWGKKLEDEPDHGPKVYQLQIQRPVDVKGSLFYVVF